VTVALRVSEYGEQVGVLAGYRRLGDAAVVRRINRLVRRLSSQERDPLRPIDLLILRPSVDLDALADDYRLEMSGAMGSLLSAVEWQDDPQPDWLSMLLFKPDYLQRLLDVGYNDAKRQHDRIEAFFARDPDPTTDPGHAPSVSTRS
jgi:hypothetical protein